MVLKGFILKGSMPLWRKKKGTTSVPLVPLAYLVTVFFFTPGSAAAI
jgi:hypothetical protein